MTAAAKDGSLSARGGSMTSRSRSSTNNVPMNIHSTNFLKLVERTTDNFDGGDDTGAEEVRRILLQVRSNYDAVHHEAEQKEAKLKQLREQIRAADASHFNRSEDTHKLDDSWNQLQEKFDETTKRIIETKTSKKVYEHMLARIQKEQAILKQKMLMMDQHMGRKTRELEQGVLEAERTHRGKVLSDKNLDALERDADTERDACSLAREVMEGELDRRKEANKRRADFESWRHEVALEAANEAFNASAGRLRKLYAIEKLQGNCLQKITYEQVERSQTTEDGFQKIRDVTGLADVMDIVHKFLNRDVEHEQLKASVKDAEVRLEALRQDFDAFKRETEGITFDSVGAGRSGMIYKVVEEKESALSDALKAHEMCRMRLQKTTLQTEHMKRWTARVGQYFAVSEDPVSVQTPGDLPAFFRQLDRRVHDFLAFVKQQISEGKITRKALSQKRTQENNEQARLLANDQFLRSNCRVPKSADDRPASRQGVGHVDEDDDSLFAQDREAAKQVAQAQLVEAQKKRQKDR